jgi:hypothetical protein
MKGSVVMPDFNSIFPNFSSNCVNLKNILTPLAYLLLVGGMISSTIAGHRSGSAYLRTFGRTLIFIVVLTFLVSWGNSITSLVDSTVKQTLGVDPSKIYSDYQQALQVKKAANGETGWWQKVFEWKASLLEAILTGVLWLFGWIASAIMWWGYVLQTAILFVGYSLSPIFIGFLAFQSLHEVGKRYFLNLVGIMLWPLGWGVAGLITQGMISFMTDRSFLVSNQVFGNAEYSLQNLLGVAFLGVWVIFSTIAAPVIIQDAIVTGSSAASQMFSGAFAAGRTAATVGATTLAIAGTGASGMGAAGAGMISMASAAEALGTASINGGNGGGSLIGSLSGARSKSQEGNGEKSNTNSFPPNDPTGDKTVAALIRKTRNPFSSQGG